MVAIHTSEDIIRALREDPDMLDQVRRAVMTDEVLALPGQFVEMLDTQNSMLETQNRILADLAETRQTQNSMLETQNRLLAGQDEMRGDMKELHGMYRRQHDDLGNFRGNYASEAARKYDAGICQLFADLHGLRRIMRRRLTEDELRDMLVKNAEAMDVLNLRDRAWLTFDSADIIAEITERNNSEPRFYVAVEASYTGNMEDVLRATDHAKILRCATGLDAYAVVAAVRMAPGVEDSVFEDVTEFLDANDEDVPLWYRLGEDGMEPPAPR